MITLLAYSISCWGSKSFNPSTGERATPSDSVLISYNDLRIANSKFIELEYEKIANSKLRQIVTNDSVIIDEYRNITDRLTKKNKKFKRQRNFFASITGILVAVTTVLLVVK